MNNAEARVRTTMATAVAVSMLAAIAAMALGLNGQQLWAIIAWAVAVVAAVVAFVVYRRYSSLRAVRWQEELRESERRVADMLDQPDAAPTPGDRPGNPTPS